jgi:diadenosine tetraphosphate (Ap4A) HIT family hydrolase
VHLHIIPREDTHTNIGQIKFNISAERNPSEMAEEADTLRQFFEKRDDIAQFNKSTYI